MDTTGDRCSHIRMEVKPKALAAKASKPAPASQAAQLREEQKPADVPAQTIQQRLRPLTASSLEHLAAQTMDVLGLAAKE